jgi:single-stranded-DNA-specific exonuclease
VLSGCLGKQKPAGTTKPPPIAANNQSQIPLNTNILTPGARTIVAAYAERRGIAPAQLNEFLNPKLDLAPCVLPDADKVLSRLNHAVAESERVLIFGDYDADGITATSILLRFLDECMSQTPHWSLPNRQTDHYGLDLKKAKSLVCQHRPSLLLCLDCGTNSGEAILWLKQNGVDTIVVDHHPAEDLSTQALAMVNPKAHPESKSDLDDLCAAGLTMVLCHYLAGAWHCLERWDRVAATMLAGLGTLADVVPMTPINRAISKNAITLINTPARRNRITGLAALVPADGQRLTQRRLQFEVIPALNALGRLGSAEPGVTLLTTTNQVVAEEIAGLCLELNEARKAKQQEMTEKAGNLARGVLNDHPDVAVLVLADQSWHHGVAGPAASQIAEKFVRSTILLAPNGLDGQWKGSGRSCNQDDLGGWIRAVKALGLVDRGGGHPGEGTNV